MLITAVLLMMISSVSAQQPTADEMADYFFQEFNRIVREDYGGTALAHNDILQDIAQKIADNIGCREDTIEFDIQGDAYDLGYIPYPSYGQIPRTTRVPLIPVVNNRPIETLIENYANVIYNTNIRGAGLFYREIGVGVSVCQNTRTPQYSLIVVLGAQPDVRPLVIENGTPELEVEAAPATVMLSIHEENSRRSPGIFGKAASMRLSLSPLDDRVAQQEYQPALEFELPTCGENTIYYELTDTEGVVVTGETSVELICGEVASDS
jgi:hypothetical protein